MIKLPLVRFSRTRGGYRFKDQLELGRLGTVENDFNVVLDAFKARSTKGEPAALSLSNWSTGEMSGTTWKSADGLLLEYLAGPEEGRAKRLEEILLAASALGYGFWLLDTCTRQGERTYTVCWAFDDTVDKNQYVRLASVMAERMGVYLAADGVVSQTHLVHLHPDSWVVASPGGAIPAKMLIHQTAKMYQSMDPTRFRRAKAKVRAADVQLAVPVSTAGETVFDDLFCLPNANIAD